MTPTRSRPSPSPLRPTPAPSPLVGVADTVLTTAVRRVEAQWKELHDIGGTSAVTQDVPRLLAAIALAVDRRDPEYVAGLTPRPSLRLTYHLLDMLQRELLREWQSVPTPAFRVLKLLVALKELRGVIESRASRLLGAPLTSPDGLEFLVEVFHDLHSPLTSVLFLAETLQQGRSGAVNELQRRQLGLIYSAALGLNGITTNALELAREGDQLMEDEATPFSVTELVEGVWDIVRPMAEEKGLPVNLLTAEVDQRIGYPLELSRVLLNLVTNALKFTHDGFVEVGVTELDEQRIEFAVRDTGPGINPDALTTLYQPFRRATRTGGYAFSSTGLGLAIARRVVEAIGSRLELDTRAGWGTRFFFEVTLPPA